MTDNPPQPGDPADPDDTNAGGEPAPPGGPGGPAPVFGNVDQWVSEYLAPTWRRRIDGRTRWWAADWWRYPEAVQRLTALWRAWEHLRLDGTTGLSVFWRDHLDPHMQALTGPDGLFAEHGFDQHNASRAGQPLPCDPPNPPYPDQRGAPAR